MDIIRYSDHYLARYTDPPTIEVDATLVDISHGPTGSELRFRGVEVAPIQARDDALAQDIVTRNSAWFPDNGMSDTEVRALLRPSIGAAGALTCTCKIADALHIIRDGCEIDFADVRPESLPSRVRVSLANIGARIRADAATGVWEPRWINMTPILGIVYGGGEDETAEPPEDACADAEDALRELVDGVAARARAVANQAINEANAMDELLRSLPALRGTAEWGARVEELQAASYDS